MLTQYLFLSHQLQQRIEQVSQRPLRMPDPLSVPPNVFLIDNIMEQCQDEEKRIAEIKCRRNDFAPVSRLPIFLLTSIFLFFPAIRRENDDLYRDLEDEDAYYPTWLAI